MARYICLIRTDIPEGTLQVLDLQPNKSQQNLVYDPPAQTRYVSFRPQNDTVVTTGAGPITTVGALNGLAAYLIDRVENTGGAAAALTAAEANSVAAALIARMDAGQTLTLANINTEINVPGGVSGSDLDGTLGDSTGTVVEVLQILAGEVYTVPTGSAVEDGGNDFDATIFGAFADPARVIDIEQTGSFELSRNQGELAALKAATFEYLGTPGAAVVVYDGTGALL